MPEFLFLSFQEYSKACLELAVKIKKAYSTSPSIDYLVSIQRGGAVMSKLLSDVLDIPIATIVVSSYQDLQQAKKPVVTQDLSVDITDKHILAIDEISDSGDTLHLVEKHFQQRNPASMKTAALFIKPATKFVPDFWARESSKWVVFPGELKETAQSIRSFGSLTPQMQQEFKDFAAGHGLTPELQKELQIEV